ncbi:MAG: ExeA family protein, partial [Phycisphaerae bacterium]
MEIGRMYCRFFGFRSPPFDSSPDPAFFFKTPDHEEALASLRYAVEHRKGFVLLTGEVGAGKTLLSRVLLERLRPGTRTAVITNTHLSAAELLWSLCREFGLPVRDSASQAELIEALEDFLLDGYANGKDAVVVLDEAQNLPLESLEQVRMLGNLEAHDAKLVQILILGQPELRRRFAQLRQRIFRAFHLVGLNRQQTAEYIRHRLAVAGGTGKVSFAPEAIALIHQSAQGLPRGINQLCDNALLTAYARSQRCVTAEIVQTVIDEMQQLDGSASDDDGAARAQPSAAEPAASQPPGQLHSHLEDSQQRLAEISERLEQVGSVAGRLDEL